ncbi:MAG: vanadium-dependent haloperoxidase, partial [Flavobacteriaceae bacterium]|nr:vanadium-dependent haloperoxidase [Flavobacteriaceae bacterium]
HTELAAIHAFLKVGTALIFSENKIIEYRDSLYASLEQDGLPSSVKEASLAYGDLIAAHILAWADTDFYKQTRTFPKYTIQEGTAFWKPTPPDYMEGIEPHWNKIRTLVLDTADQFEPAPPYPVDMSKDSPFYKELMEVYELGEKIDGSTEATEIASFWDCNPYVSHHRGHAMFATKKITPGGHWIGITKIAAKQAQSNMDESINAYARVSIALFDGFISCWNTKWNTLIVRPETIINEFLDETWLPLLQTPPFPEYTSGHSVISRASAVALTDIYGDAFSFADTTEEVYGLGVRSYDSFIAASEEAAVSRLYGGIHYRRAIDEGVKQGDAVGKFLVEKLKTLK